MFPRRNARGPSRGPMDTKRINGTSHRKFRQRETNGESRNKPRGVKTEREEAKETTEEWYERTVIFLPDTENGKPRRGEMAEIATAVKQVADVVDIRMVRHMVWVEVRNANQAARVQREWFKMEKTASPTPEGRMR